MYRVSRNYVSRLCMVVDLGLKRIYVQGTYPRKIHLNPLITGQSVDFFFLVLKNSAHRVDQKKFLGHFPQMNFSMRKKSLKN